VTIRRILPAPSPFTQPFWDAAAEGTLVIQRCADCGRYQHPPRPLCPGCGSVAVAFEPVSGEGRLWSWTVLHHKVVAGMEEALPYACLVVELVEQPGLFFVTDRIGTDGIDSSQWRLGAPVRARFDCVVDGFVLPQFDIVFKEEVAS